MMFSLDALARQNGHHGLSSRERANLRRKLDSAATQFLAEYDQLRDASPATVASYGRTALATDWLMCCVETGRAKIELDEAVPVADTGTGTDPSTDRCPSCGHLTGAGCDCFCCVPLDDCLHGFIRVTCRTCHGGA